MFSVLLLSITTTPFNNGGVVGTAEFLKGEACSRNNSGNHTSTVAVIKPAWYQLGVCVDSLNNGNKSSRNDFLLWATC